MPQLAQSLLDGSLVVSVEAIVDAIRTLAVRGRIVAEGAGAAPVAAALAGVKKEFISRLICKMLDELDKLIKNIKDNYKEKDYKEDFNSLIEDSSGKCASFTAAFKALYLL